MAEVLLQPLFLGAYEEFSQFIVILLISIMFSIADKLKNVRSRIQKATISAQRLKGSVDLLPVSKKHPAEAVLEAYAEGCSAFGENYVSEALDKQGEVARLAPDIAPTIVWHFIGPVQSNKTRVIAENFDWVQSLDREKIANRLNDQRPDSLPPLNVCIQVNIDDESTKSGISLQDLDAFAEFVNQLPRLCLRGLMTIPSASADDEALSASMAALSLAFGRLKAQYSSMDTLSMGMSSDLDIAIQNGSTMVRVGTAIFGARDKT